MPVFPISAKTLMKTKTHVSRLSLKIKKGEANLCRQFSIDHVFLIINYTEKCSKFSKNLIFLASFKPS